MTLCLPVQHRLVLFFSTWTQILQPQCLHLSVMVFSACLTPGRPLSSSPSPHPPSPPPPQGFSALPPPCPQSVCPSSFLYPNHSRLSQKFHSLKEMQKNTWEDGGDPPWYWVACLLLGDWQLRVTLAPTWATPREMAGWREPEELGEGRQVKYIRGPTAHRTEEGPGVFPLQVPQPQWYTPGGHGVDQGCSRFVDMTSVRFANIVGGSNTSPSPCAYSVPRAQLRPPSPNWGSSNTPYLHRPLTLWPLHPPLSLATLTTPDPLHQHRSVPLDGYPSSPVWGVEKAAHKSLGDYQPANGPELQVDGRE